jgi:hypothetical protein
LAWELFTPQTEIEKRILILPPEVAYTSINVFSNANMEGYSAK